MSEQGQVAVAISLTEDLHAPEIYASDAVGFLLHSGNVHVTFAATRASHTQNPAPVTRVVVARLVLPPEGAKGLALGLYNFLKNHGMDPAPAPDRSQMQ